MDHLPTVSTGRWSAGLPLLCSFTRHYRTGKEASATNRGLTGNVGGTGFFCNEPGLSIVYHRSYLSGRIEPFRYCSTHGRLLADELAALAGAD